MQNIFKGNRDQGKSHDEGIADLQADTSLVPLYFVIGSHLCMVWTEMEREIRERHICFKTAYCHNA